MTDAVTNAELDRSVTAIKENVKSNIDSVKDDINLIRTDVKSLLDMQQAFINQQTETNTLLTYQTSEQEKKITSLEQLKITVDKHEPEIESFKGFKKTTFRLMLGSFLSFFGAAGTGAYHFVINKPPETVVKPVEILIKPLETVKESKK